MAAGRLDARIGEGGGPETGPKRLAENPRASDRRENRQAIDYLVLSRDFAVIETPSDGQ